MFRKRPAPCMQPWVYRAGLPSALMDREGTCSHLDRSGSRLEQLRFRHGRATDSRGMCGAACRPLFPACRVLGYMAFTLLQACQLLLRAAECALCTMNAVQCMPPVERSGLGSCRQDSARFAWYRLCAFTLNV